MKRWVFVLIAAAAILNGCRDEGSTLYMTNQKALAYFEQVKQICDEDNGELWGENLYGPIMLVDTDTRRLFSNVQDEEGLLKPKDGIFTGVYPGEEIINNFAVRFGNTLFAMAPLPREEDSHRIILRCLHGLFHCYQVNNSISSPEFNPVHMNEAAARLWLKMEWKALEKAIRTTGDTRVQAIRDALVFRKTRREIFPAYSDDENRFENYEGLATFTYMLLGNSDHDSYTMAMLEYLHRIYEFSYAQSYGFVHGALYAYLLHEDGFDFSTIDEIGVDLGEITRERLNISLPEICRDIAGSLAINYDIDIVRDEEARRAERIKETLRKKTASFTDKSVVYLMLESPSFSFEPEDIDPVDTLGVIYQKLRVSDNWGKIIVTEGGCLVSPNLQFIRVPARGIKTDRNHITAEGWSMILNESWELEEIDNNYYVRKLIP